MSSHRVICSIKPLAKWRSTYNLCHRYHKRQLEHYVQVSKSDSKTTANTPLLAEKLSLEFATAIQGLTHDLNLVIRTTRFVNIVVDTKVFDAVVPEGSHIEYRGSCRECKALSVGNAKSRCQVKLKSLEHNACDSRRRNFMRKERPWLSLVNTKKQSKPIIAVQRSSRQSFVTMEPRQMGNSQQEFTRKLHHVGGLSMRGS